MCSRVFSLTEHGLMDSHSNYSAHLWVVQFRKFNQCSRSDDRHKSKCGQNSKSSLDHVSKPISILRFQNIIADLKRTERKIYSSLYMMYGGGGGGGGAFCDRQIALQ